MRFPFAGNTLPQHHKKDIQLNDIQYVIAREYGFKTWTHLKNFVQKAASPYAFIQVDDILKDFLKAKYRKTEISILMKHKRSVKDAIESLGIPHTEIGKVILNDEEISLSSILYAGQSIQVSAPELIPFQEAPRFILDTHLGKLTHYLRMLGFDCLQQSDYSNENLLGYALAENRILLTRNRDLLKHACVKSGVYIRDDKPDEQAKCIIRRFKIADWIQPKTRCSVCNGDLITVDKRGC